MQHILLRYCREQSRLTEKQVAAKTGLTLKRYQQLETTEALMTTSESKALGRVFNIDHSYLWISASQLEELQTAKELVQLQKQRIHILTIGT